MKIGLRIFLGYFLIVALAALLLAQVFVAEVKPGVRQAMEDTLVDTANVLAELATDDLLAGRIDDGAFARRVRALRGRDFGADIWGFDKRGSNYRVYVTDARGIVVFDSTGRDVGKDYSRWNDVYLTLRGPLRRAFDRQRPGRRGLDRDARRRADPRCRRRHRRRADRGQAEPRAGAVHRAQPAAW